VGTGTFGTLTLFKTPKYSKTIPYIRHYGILGTLFKTERKITFFSYFVLILVNCKTGGAKNPTLASGTSPYSEYMRACLCAAVQVLYLQIRVLPNIKSLFGELFVSDVV